MTSQETLVKTAKIVIEQNSCFEPYYVDCDKCPASHSHSGTRCSDKSKLGKSPPSEWLKDYVAQHETRQPSQSLYIPRLKATIKIDDVIDSTTAIGTVVWIGNDGQKILIEQSNKYGIRVSGHNGRGYGYEGPSLRHGWWISPENVMKVVETSHRHNPIIPIDSEPTLPTDDTTLRISLLV